MARKARYILTIDNLLNRATLRREQQRNKTMDKKPGKKDYKPRTLTKSEEQINAAQKRMNLLDSKISAGHQDYTVTQLYEAVFEYTRGALKQTIRQKLRITIKSDSYAAQCFARISVYSPEERKWNRLAYIEYCHMVTEHGLSHRQDAPTEYEFQHDINELMRLADLILA